MFRKTASILALLLVVAPSLSGCWAAAGAAAGSAAGYYVGKDERSAKQIADDAAITAKIKTQFIDDDDISAMKINVDTYYNVVTLRGDVPSRTIAQRALDLARSTKGVKAVRSELTIVRR